MLRFFVLTISLHAADGFIGSAECAVCHKSQFDSQSKTGHAHALAKSADHAQRAQWPLVTTEARRAPNFRFRFDGLTARIDNGADVLAVPMEWAFGAGAQAVTFVSRADAGNHIEHFLSYYTKLRAFGPTPGQSKLKPANLAEAAGLLYRNADVEACFECHSTGKEFGVRCEACHGPGAKHAASAGKANIVNPAKLSAAALNDYCGKCHRPPASDPAKVDWNFAWNVRHQPVYLSQSKCFKQSAGKMSCLTCHAPHEPLVQQSAHYDAKCATCHTTRASACAPTNCANCHMPQVSPEPPLRFANHWIGVYKGGAALRPVR
jgi:formate-dependent nitrite reductase cytochrome c552 subunit